MFTGLLCSRLAQHGRAFQVRGRGGHDRCSEQAGLVLQGQGPARDVQYAETSGQHDASQSPRKCRRGGGATSRQS
jgi:hypothetical protein